MNKVLVTICTLVLAVLACTTEQAAGTLTAMPTPSPTAQILRQAVANTPLSTQVVLATSSTCTITANLNLRKDAGINAQVLTVLAMGETVEWHGQWKSDEDGVWFLVTANTLEGWIDNQYQTGCVGK